MNSEKIIEGIKKITKADKITYEGFNQHKEEIFSYIEGYVDGRMFEPLNKFYQEKQ
jgi:hypothetical protein